MQTRFIKTKRAVIGAIGAAALLAAGAAQAAGVPGQGTWETTLLPRDLNADGYVDAFYDTTLNISWLAGTWGPGYWINASTDAAGLDWFGVKGWRMPTMIDTGAPGCDFSFAGGTDCGYNVQTKSGATVYSEMAHLFYVTLGNKAYYDTSGNPDQPGWGLTNTGNFFYLPMGTYWTDLTDPGSDGIWAFSMGGSNQNPVAVLNRNYALFVHAGDVGAVPEPETYALMLVGLTALMVARRRLGRGFGTSRSEC